MAWSFRIARIAGIELRVHLTFFLLLLWLGVIYYQAGGWAQASAGIAFILALFGCVLLHELGHALAARAFGIRTPDITLLPIGGLARLERMPEKPWQEIVVALAGPAVNVVIAAIALAALPAGYAFDPEVLASPAGDFLPKLALVNIILLLFNLIPAFPMDGGRVLRAVLAMFLPYAQATRLAARLGQGLAFVFGFLGLLFNPWWVFIALFIFLGASSEATHAEMTDLSRRLAVRDAMMTELVTLRDDTTVDEAIEALLRTAQHEFPVLDEAGRFRGVLTRNAMISALKKTGGATPVAEVMHRDLPAVSASTPFEEAFARMNACNCPALPVLDGDGRLAGLITPENVGELMLVQSLRSAPANPRWRHAWTRS